MKKKTTTAVLVKARLTPGTHRRLKAYAAHRGETIPQTVEHMLSKHLPKAQK